jgi:hypothetical protein
MKDFLVVLIFLLSCFLVLDAAVLILDVIVIVVPTWLIVVFILILPLPAESCSDPPVFPVTIERNRSGNGIYFINIWKEQASDCCPVIVAHCHRGPLG